jgi:hypothetical protein
MDPHVAEKDRRPRTGGCRHGRFMGRIGIVKLQCPLVLTVLIYVTLDLSLAAMPGAFVFEAEDSAESTQVRARAADERVALSALAHDPVFVLFQPALGIDERLAPTPVRSAEWRGRALVSWRSRAHHDSAPPSEDPH